MEMAGWKTIRTDSFRYVTEFDGRESLYVLKKNKKIKLLLTFKGA